MNIMHHNSLKMHPSSCKNFRWIWENSPMTSQIEVYLWHRYNKFRHTWCILSAYYFNDIWYVKCMEDIPYSHIFHIIQWFRWLPLLLFIQSWKNWIHWGLDAKKHQVNQVTVSLDIMTYQWPHMWICLSAIPGLFHLGEKSFSYVITWRWVFCWGRKSKFQRFVFYPFRLKRCCCCCCCCCCRRSLKRWIHNCGFCPPVEMRYFFGWTYYCSQM